MSATISKLAVKQCNICRLEVPFLERRDVRRGNVANGGAARRNVAESRKCPAEVNGPAGAMYPEIHPIILPVEFPRKALEHPSAAMQTRLDRLRESFFV